eukprot:TRINITY_DN6231_c0_g1_i1.p1 TRINITY_DN6231_c0_g1~~TRINITY_DN6231_c0_g1_i1.p1  ORF type:complete len:146 (+),score=22.64 TRINITY_DN6231_c0_g1_i1:134-571(+)
MSGAGSGGGCASGGVPSACIYSSLAAVGGVAACAVLSARFSSDTTVCKRYEGSLWGLLTGLGSGALMLHLRGRKHVVPCHWPCYGGLVAPAALAWWLAERSSASGKKESERTQSTSTVGFVAQFFTAMLGGLTLVFYVSPEDGRP